LTTDGKASASNPSGGDQPRRKQPTIRETQNRCSVANTATLKLSTLSSTLRSEQQTKVQEVRAVHFLWKLCKRGKESQNRVVCSTSLPPFFGGGGKIIMVLSRFSRQTRCCYGKSVLLSFCHTLVLIETNALVVKLFPPSGSGMTIFFRALPLYKILSSDSCVCLELFAIERQDCLVSERVSGRPENSSVQGIV